jgi:predicted adenylyl cyclase CyaB
LPSNLEIKAVIPSLARARSIATKLGARYIGELRQTDTYFKVKEGRLKLREFVDGNAELIQYRRREVTRERLSKFTIYSCHDPLRLKEVLEGSLGVLAVVKKRRELFLYESTRIHLDRVEGLGFFLELETPVRTSSEHARKINRFLVNRFGIAPKDYLKHSYLDLIRSKRFAGRKRENRSVLN